MMQAKGVLKAEDKRISPISRSSFILAGSVFCLLTVAFVALGWRTIQGTSIEGYDPAANSTLIHYAKHFRLAIGNYSRIGFNHPGPAILYVLAAGEALFYDAMRLVPSPVAGQMMAVAFYSAFWSALSALTLWRVGFTRVQAVLILLCLLAFISLEQPSTFNELWFPRLYTMPFACFTVALTGIMAGYRPSWTTAALAFGFLENGHVCFIGICAVMCGAAALWAGLEAVQRPTPSRMAIMPDRWMVSAAIVTALFILPLAWRELRHHPGPIEQYASFAHANTGHGLAAAEGFLLAQIGPGQWTKGAALSAAFILFALNTATPTRSITAGLVAAVLGTLYYAVAGIDDFSMSYTVIFFATVPGLAIGAALASLCALAPRRVGAVAACLCTLAAVISCGKQILSVGPVGAYDVPEIADLDRAIRDHGPAPLALDLDTSATGNFTVWTMMVGVQAYELRRDGHLSFCIAQGWHIAFTEAARCPDEGRGLQHVRIEPATSAPAGSSGGAGVAAVAESD